MTLTGSMESVGRLNELLRQRAALGGDLRPALAASYLVHALGLLALTLAIQTGETAKSYVPRGAGGIMPITPLRGLPNQAPTAKAAQPQPAAVPAAAAPDPVPPPRAAPPAAVAPKPVVAAPKPEPARRPTRTESRIHEERRAAENRPAKPAATDPNTTKGNPAPAAAAAPAAARRLLAPTTGPSGSASGSIDGAPDGGLGTLLGSNQWYVQRVQEIVYMNWADPFAGGNRPELEIEVEVAFRIHRDGRVTEVSINRSSGNPRWDRAGLRAAESSRLPPLPADHYGESVRVLYTFYNDLRR